MKIKVRYQKPADAKRFFEILNSLKTGFFPRVRSIKEEEKILKKHVEERKKKHQYDFSIIYNKKLVGGAGIKIDLMHQGSAEIGYFIDKEYQRRGIATKTVKLLENFAFTKLKISRLEIRMNIKNKPSQKVAIKAGYTKEGKIKINKDREDYIYGKIK